MAGSQTELDFRGADADAEAVARFRQAQFVRQITELREALGSIEADAVGLSPRLWQNVKSLIMATRSYELDGREPQLEDLLKSSGLSRRQWVAARQMALRLRLVVAVRTYHGTSRRKDSLAVAIEVILSRARCDEIARPQGVCRPSADRPQGVSSSPVESRQSRAPAALDLTLNTKTPASAAAKTEERRGAAAAVVEVSEWESARPLANRLWRAMYPDVALSKLSAGERAWIARVAVLGVRFGEGWLAPALERLRHGQVRSPQNLVAVILDDECQRLGTRLNRELAGVSLPPSISP